MTQLRGGSVWEQELHSHLSSHLESEQELLAEYARLAAEGPESLSYVLNLILADERRHHELFADLVRTVEGDAQFSRQPPPVPHLDAWGNRERVLEVTAKFIAAEKEDAKELRRLAKSLHDVQDTTLWGMIVDTMRRDTDKHIAMLEFVHGAADATSEQLGGNVSTSEDTRYVELSREECLDLLRAHRVGRLAVVAGGQPLIYPVNYVIDGDMVVFRNDPGTKLTNARLDRVAFEIDEIDEARHQGWSVLVQGTAVEITTALDVASERERALELHPWAPGEKAYWARIITREITGRRLERP